MKLFEVEITIRAVVAAADNAGAMKVAHGARRQIVSDDALDDLFIACEIKAGDQLPDGWDEDCYPYGDDTATIKKIMEGQPPVIEPDTKTIDMFAGVAP